MRIEAIPSGTRLGVDANVFVYHFTGASPACTALLLRCERRDVTGFVTTAILAETLHRLMILEALRKGVIRGSNPAKRLRENPDLTRTLEEYARAGDAMLRMGLEFLPIEPRTLLASQPVRLLHGLLVNDSLTVAALQDAGVSWLVTADADFERIPGLTVCRPRDLSDKAQA